MVTRRSLLATGALLPFMRVAHGQGRVLPAQPNYTPYEIPSGARLEVEDGFRLPTGILFSLRWSQTEGPDGKTFFCPGAADMAIDSVQRCYEIHVRGASSHRSISATETITRSLGLTMRESEGESSRLAGSPHENTMQLSCPSGVQSHVPSLTEEEKQKIGWQLRTGQTTLMALPDLYSRPRGYVLPDQTTLIILQNDTQWSNPNRQSHLVFHQGRSDTPFIERASTYHDGRSSSLAVPGTDGQRAAGFRIAEVGVLTLPSLRDIMSSSTPPMPRLNGTPVIRALSDDELAKILGILSPEHPALMAPSRIIGPCSGSGVRIG